MKAYILITVLGLCLAIPGYAQSEQDPPKEEGNPTEAPEEAAAEERKAEAKQPAAGLRKRATRPATKGGRQPKGGKNRPQAGGRSPAGGKGGLKAGAPPPRQEIKNYNSSKSNTSAINIEEEDDLNKLRKRKGVRGRKPKGGKGLPAAGKNYNSTRSNKSRTPKGVRGRKPKGGKVAISDELAFPSSPNHDGPPPRIFVALEKVFGPEAAPDKGVPIGKVFAALKRLDANGDGKLSPAELFHAKHE